MSAIIAMARQNFDKALAEPVDLPDAGPRWATLAAWCRTKIPEFATVAEAIQFAQLPDGHGGFESRHRGDDLLTFAGEQEAFIRANFPHYAEHRISFNEPDFANPESTAIVDGRRVSGPLYAHITFFLIIAAQVPSTDVVCEIGGGYGAPARLFLTNTYRPTRTYVLIDLPESLFFAECYLRETLGDDAVLYADRPLTRDDAARYRAILCPVGRIGCLDGLHFDLVQNTLSMQEMSDAYVDFYARWLERQSADYFFSFNYFFQNLDDRAESSNFFAPRLPGDWEIQWSTFAALDALTSRFLPLVARRAGASNATFAIDRPLTPQSLYPLMHAAGQASRPEFPFRLLRAINEDIPYTPKEAVYLCELIDRLEYNGEMLPLLDRWQFRLIKRRLARHTARSVSNRVPPHLEGLKSQLNAHR